MHTNLGDLKIELFCELIPKNAQVCRERKIAICRISWLSVQADITITQSSTGSLSKIGLSRRNMKGFIIQGGDPTGIHTFTS